MENPQSRFDKNGSVINDQNYENFLALQVHKIIRETPDSKTFLFKEVNGKNISFLPGQFLTFPLLINGEEVRKNYSICTAPFELPVIGITVKKTAEGHSSDFIIENLHEGDVLRSYPPVGEFTIDPSAGNKSELVLIGAGSGITPLMSILKTTLYIEERSQVTLYYGNRNEESIIFRQNLEDLQKLYNKRLKVVHFLTQPSEPASTKDQFSCIVRGRITRESFKERLKTDGFTENTHFYICGPEGMIAGVINGLRDIGVNAPRIHTEYYKITIAQDAFVDEAEIKTRKVTIIFEGKEHVITVKPYDSILESALKQGLQLPNSCQVGQCSSCRARLISGKINLVEQTALEDWEIKEGYCLTCVGFPMSDDVVIDYDATARF